MRSERCMKSHCEEHDSKATVQNIVQIFSNFLLPDRHGKLPRSTLALSDQEGATLSVSESTFCHTARYATGEPAAGQSSKNKNRQKKASEQTKKERGHRCYRFMQVNSPDLSISSRRLHTHSNLRKEVCGYLLTLKETERRAAHKSTDQRAERENERSEFSTRC